MSDVVNIARTLQSPYAGSPTSEACMRQAPVVTVNKQRRIQEPTNYTSDHYFSWLP
jgi:hypothetical protein